MKILTISLLFAAVIAAQTNAVPAKPEVPASVKAPEVTPLTAEEKLAIRDLQLAITQMKHQQDVELPKAINEAQDKINKIVQEFQVKHNAQAATLKYDLNWELPAKESPKEAKK